MAVSVGNLKFDLDDQNLSDLKGLNACTVLISASGWKSSNLCHDGQFINVCIGLDAFPIPADMRITAATISGTYNGPRGTIGFAATNSFVDLSNFTNIIPVNGGGFSFEAGINTSDYGVPLSFAVAVLAPVDPGATIYINSIIFETLVDDSLPEGLPGNTSPPPVDNTCADTVEYTYGFGPDCVKALTDYEFDSNSTLGVNALVMTFDTATQIQFKSFDNFDLTRVNHDPIIVIEAPLGTITYTGNRQNITAPTGLLQTFIAKRVSIYYRPFDAAFKLHAYIGNIYDTDSPPESTPGVNYGDVFTGLNNIVDAINDEKSTLDDTIHTGLFDLKSILANLSQDLPQGLVSSLVSSLTGIPQDISSSLLSNLKIPPELVQDFLNFIHTILVSEVMSAEQGAQTLALNIQEYLINHVDSQNNNFGGTISQQEKVVNDLLSGKYSDADSFFSDLQNAGNNIALIQWLQNAYLLIFGTFDFLKSKTEVAGIVTKQILLGEYTPTPLDINSLITGMYREILSLNQVYSGAQKLGLSRENVNILTETSRPLTPVGIIKDVYLLGYITSDQHDELMGKLGFGIDDINLIKASYNIIPNPQDITRLADKHIFNTDIPTYFGQYAEIDQGYRDAMAKFGYSADWVNKLWASHWQLPGFQQIFDMFHRGIISDAELNDAFALSDILPFFRDKLKLLNYALITRVDIRRFYSEGIFNEQQVLDAYKKLGFDDTNAQLQTQYTVLHERDSQNPAKIKVRTLTESMVVKAYKAGIINENEAVTRLGQVGYLAPDAELILRLETQIDNTSILADKTQHYHDKTFNHVLSSFTKGTISEDEARAMLAALGTPQAEIESEIAYAKIESVIALKDFVEEHIRSAYTGGQISQIDAINYMTSVGFNMTEINYLFEELNLVKGLRNKALSEAQIKEIFASGQISRDDVKQELMNIGYGDQRATWLTNVIAPGV